MIGLIRFINGETSMKKPFYKILYVQVLFAIACGVLLGVFYPDLGVQMKPLGDGFIKLIKMIIAPVIFCTVVAGIAGMQDMKKIGRVGGKALLYFEVVSTIALAIGLIVANVIRPGDGFNANPATLDAKSIAEFTAKAKSQTTTDFIMNIIPNTAFDAFAKGEILQVLLVANLLKPGAGFNANPALLDTKGIAEFVTKKPPGLVDFLLNIIPNTVIDALAPIYRFRDETDVVAQANATPFGLAAYFYARDLGRVFRVAEALDYGIVGVNAGVVATEVAPFGGVKESGLGREGSHHGIEEFVEMKYVLLAGLAA
jgi:hypothetical protein